MTFPRTSYELVATATTTYDVLGQALVRFATAAGMSCELVATAATTYDVLGRVFRPGSALLLPVIAAGGEQGGERFLHLVEVEPHGVLGLQRGGAGNGGDYRPVFDL